MGAMDAIDGRRCPKCRGKGKVDGKRCSKCKGKGSI